MSSTYNIAVYESIQSVNEKVVRLFQGNDSILLDPEQGAILSELLVDVSLHDATALDDTVSITLLPKELLCRQCGPECHAAHETCKLSRCLMTHH